VIRNKLLVVTNVYPNICSQQEAIKHQSGIQNSYNLFVICIQVISVIYIFSIETLKMSDLYMDLLLKSC